jgi:hypothetical protein
LKSKNEALKATDTTKDPHLVINPKRVMLGVKNSIRIAFLDNLKELEWYESKIPLALHCLRSQGLECQRRKKMLAFMNVGIIYISVRAA